MGDHGCRCSYRVGGYYGIPWDKMGVSEWAYWLGAVGTIGAMIGTIWLATTESRRRARAETRRAYLHAASFILRLSRAHALLKQACNQLKVYALTDHPPEAIISAKQYLTKIDLWDVDDLIPLASLRGDSTFQLAEACTEIRSGIFSFEVAESSNVLATEAGRQNFCNGIAGLLALTANKGAAASAVLGPSVHMFRIVNREI